MATEKSVLGVIRASRPSFRNPHDKVAFAIHASFLASGFVLNATGSPAFSDNALSSSSTDEVGIDHWNENDEAYAFVYTSTDRDAKKVLVKCLVMNDKLLVDALADGSSEPVHLAINVEDYVANIESSNYSDQFKNLDKLLSSLDESIMSKLTGSSRRTSTSKPSSLNTREGPRHGRTEGGMVISGPPSPPPFVPRVVYPSLYPSYGSDVLPGPGAGMYPGRVDPGGSMLVGPNDPRWFGGVGIEPGFPGGEVGVPPGARFDPYGPPGVPGFEPNRFVRNPPRRNSSNHPDLQHFPGGSDFI